MYTFQALKPAAKRTLEDNISCLNVDDCHVVLIKVCFSKPRYGELLNRQASTQNRAGAVVHTSVKLSPC